MRVAKREKNLPRTEIQQEQQQQQKLISSYNDEGSVEYSLVKCDKNEQQLKKQLVACNARKKRDKEMKPVTKNRK